MDSSIEPPETDQLRTVSARTRSKSRPRHLLFAAFAFTLATLLSLIAGEIGIRVFSSIGPRLFHKGRYEPNTNGCYLSLESNRRISIRTNAEGFRGPDVQLYKSDQVMRVAVIGDSFVAGMAVDEQETFVSLIGEKFREQNSRVEVMNFGVAGSDTADYLQFYRHFVAKYQPDIVITCFFHGNDLRDRFPELGDSATPHPFDDYFDPKFTAAKSFLGRHSRLYMWVEHHQRLARDVFREWMRQYTPDAYYAHMKRRYARRLDDYNAFLSPSDSRVSHPWWVVEQHLSALHRETAQAGTTFLVVGIPRVEQVDDRYWKLLTLESGQEDGKGWSRTFPDQQLGRIASRHHFMYFSLTETLAHENSGRKFYFGREHLNEAGHRAVADYLVDELKKIQIPSQTPQQSMAFRTRQTSHKIR